MVFYIQARSLFTLLKATVAPKGCCLKRVRQRPWTKYCGHQQQPPTLQLIFKLVRQRLEHVSLREIMTEADDRERAQRIIMSGGATHNSDKGEIVVQDLFHRHVVEAVPTL